MVGSGAWVRLPFCGFYVPAHEFWLLAHPLVFPDEPSHVAPQVVASRKSRFTGLPPGISLWGPARLDSREWAVFCMVWCDGLVLSLFSQGAGGAAGVHCPAALEGRAPPQAPQYLSCYKILSHNWITGFEQIWTLVDLGFVWA